jgi:hypothetical protein
MVIEVNRDVTGVTTILLLPSTGVKSLLGEPLADADGSRGPRKRASAVCRRLAFGAWPKRRFRDLRAHAPVALLESEPLVHAPVALPLKPL